MSAQQGSKRRTGLIIATVIAIIIIAVSAAVVYYSNLSHRASHTTSPTVPGKSSNKESNTGGTQGRSSSASITCREACIRYIRSIISRSWYNDTALMYRTVMTGTYVNASRLERYKSMLDKSVRSAIAWTDLNVLIDKSILSQLGTPEIIYLDTRTGTALIYIGLQIPMSDFMKYRGDIFSKVVAKNEVPQAVRETILNMFLKCLEDFEKGKACSGGKLVKLNSTQIRAIEDLLRWYGIEVRKGSDTLYVIFIVSPTCPFCKTEILSLYLSGVFTNMTLPGNPTIIIMPVPEHGFSDVLYVAQLYCIYKRHGIFMPVLLYMYHHYTMNGSIIYFPNSTKIDELYHVNLIQCINLPLNNITLTYTKIPIEGGYLYATFLNCTKMFYERCMRAEASNSTR
ncbi:MAG: hypothetical protein GXO23_02080 [Crenarchaeota archaeon]|nr:hypothetical protein [Thermoproteota archaeon]